VTLLSGSSSAEIDASLQRCWAVVSDVSASPRWQKGLERVDVVRSDAEGRAIVVDIVADGKVTKVHARVRVDYDPPHRVSFTRMESDDVDELEASWELAALGDGRTRATYRLAVDPGPVGLLARPLERALRPLVVGQRARELAQAVAGDGTAPSV
jgi:uncharacterized protein YndB with AHSA1/START domain